MLPVATAEIPGLQEACCLRRSVQRVGPARILDRLRPTNSSYGEICLRLDELEKLETNEECRQKVAEKRVGICQPANLGRPLVDCIVVDCGADQRRITEGTEHSAKNSINMLEPGG